MLNITAIGQDAAAIRATRHFWKTNGVNNIKEINQLYVMAHLIHIEHDKEWKDILVRDSEIRVSKQYKK